MKQSMRNFAALLLAAAVLCLAACGKTQQPSDPNHLVIGSYELQYKGARIMTDSEGKDAVVLTLDFTNNGKDNADYLWSIFNSAMQDGIELEGVIVYISEDSYKTVSDSQFTEIAPGKTIEVSLAYTLRDAEQPVEVRFTDLLEKYKETITVTPAALPRAEVRSGEAETEPAMSDTQGSDATAPTGDALLDWWNGDWYGWWMITGGDGDYEKLSNNWWDCCASIRIGADYTGSVILWDEDLPKTNAVSEASVTLSAAGTGEHGTLTSEGGYFMDGELSHADWIVDPGLMDYSDLICIDGWYEDDSGSFHYAMYLRPWGTLWEDVAEDEPDDLPYYYESWYLPLVNAGKAMPEVLGGESTAPEAPTTEPVTEPATEAAGGDTGDEYGKSVPDAQGISTLKAMQDLYKLCFENRTSAYHLFNYEDAKAALGCDGVAWKKSKYAWNETTHTYRWETEDGSEYFNISFGLEDGEEWYQSCNFSENVKNGLW